jgi:type I restriction-modification system DNA methylase subunit
MKNTAGEPQTERIRAAIETVKSRLSKDDVPDNKQLARICNDYGIRLVNSDGDPHLIHEILETSLNLHLSEAEWLKPFDAKNKHEILARLENLTRKLPPQSLRGREQKELQQFSTPPPLAFLMLQMLLPEAGKLALEPSAGTGSLAVWLKNAACRAEVNEISARRKTLLELQNYEPHSVNAEFLDDLLPARIKPDYVLMNPPFSVSGGRARRRDSNFGFRHVEAALRRLQPGGRLVALLGAESCLKTEKGKKFWHRVGREYRVHAFLIVPREVFYKYGTTFQTVAVIVSKPEINNQPIQFKPQIVESGNLSEMLRFADDFAASES